MTPIIFYQLYAQSRLGQPCNTSLCQCFWGPQRGNSGGFHAADPFDLSLYDHYSLALTWFLVVVIILFTAILFWSAPRWVHYESDMK